MSISVQFLFIISVIGQNNNPTCPVYAVSKSFPETATATTVLLTLACTDADAPPDGTISYSITSGNGLGLFSIDSSSGDISLGTAIDYDDFVTPHSFTLNVQVIDGGTPPLTAASDVVVALKVTAVNDLDPEFWSTPYTTTLPENRPFGSFVYTPTPLDLDAIDDAWTLQAFTCSKVNSDLITVNPATCEVTLAGNLDYEVATSHTITLQIADKGFTPVKTAQTNLVITVTDENDNSPICSASTYAAQIAESASIGDIIITLTCTDLDSNANGQVSYSITSGNDDGYFSVTTVGANGQIKLAKTFDYDNFLAKTTYQITVRASDGGTPVLFSDVALTIDLIGINDIDPTFFDTAVFTTSLPEDHKTVVDGTGFVYETAIIDMDLIDSVLGTFQPVTCSIASGDTTMFHAETTSTFTCKITLLKKFNLATAASHVLTLQLDDAGYTPVKTVQKSLTITVTDVNDNAPICSSSTFVAQVAENASVGDKLITLTCSDLDSNANGKVTYSIVSGNDDAYFSVSTVGANGENGEIKLAKTFDYDAFLAKTSYQIKVRASDGGTPVLSSDLDLTINLIGINDNNPEFLDTGIFTTALPENQNTIVDGTGFVYETTIFDLDLIDSVLGTFQPVTCSIAAGDKAMFRAETTTTLTCKITLLKNMDFETATSHVLTLQIDDAGYAPVKTVQKSLTITVTDVNDNAPVCTPDIHTVTIQEDATVNTVLKDLSGTCSDVETSAAALTYIITSGDTTKFQMNGASLELKSTIDVDTEADQWSIEITVNDATPQMYATPTKIYVIVIVTGIDDNIPVWHTDHNGVYTASIAENSAVGTPVQTITATDVDQAATADSTITYGIETVTSLFGIVADTGKIYITTTSLDRETAASHVLTISAYSSTMTASKITGSITITVTDENDVTPTFTQDIYTVTLPEDTAVTAISFTPPILASDTDDTGVNSQITYVLTGGHTTTGCEMSVNSGTGIISLTNNLDYENEASCTVIMEARDGGTPNLVGTATAIITVTQVNEFSPSFTGLPYSKDVSEDTAIGTSIFTIAATDADNGDDGRIEYSLTTHNDIFSIEPTTGIIRLLTGLNSEALNIYTVDVNVTDLSTTSRLSTATSVTINVLDVNEFSPSCINVVTMQLSPPVAVSDVIYTLNCTDDDTGINGQINYGFVTGNTNSDFSIAANGDVTVANVLSQLTYDLEIQAADQATVPKTSSVYVNVIIATSPTFTALPDTKNVNEATSVGTVLYTVTGNSATASKTFSITNGNGDNKFTINSYTGAIYLLNTLDRETMSNYVLTIRISDDISATFTDDTLTLNILDSNDNYPIFSADFFNIPIVESVTPTTEIIDLAATDADTGINGDIVYAITNGDPSSVFTINALGKLVLNSALDVETVSSYILIVTATDGGTPPLSGSTTCFVAISDVDEFPTEFLSTATGGIYSTSLLEDTAIGAKVFNISAQDLDATASITYSITAGNTDQSFVMDRNTADNGLGDTSTATFNIQVTDVNDNQPKFTPSTGSYNVDENEAIGALIATVICSDADDGPNSNLTYTLTAGNTGNAFRLDGTVVEVNSALDYETTSRYILVIEAKDQGTPSRSASMSIIIDVNPIYPLPAFIAATDTISKLENTIVGTVIYDCDATTAGATEGTAGALGDLNYIIQSGNGEGKFGINKHSGEIQVVAVLDRDTTASYTLLVKAVNRNDVTKKDFLSLSVTVGDINDITPSFGSSEYTFSVDENAALNTVVNTMIALDGDDGANSAIVYSFTAGENMIHFDLSSSGVITVNSALDAATQSLYYLTVSAIDGGTPSLTGTCKIKININDVNDQTPSFSAAMYNLSLSELVNVNDIVFPFRASDADTGPNSIITYSIASGNGDFRFSIDPLTGDLKLAGILDRETTGSYVLEVHASDSGIPVNTGTTLLSITVTDANDNDPVYTTGPGTPTLYVTTSRTTAVGTSLITITATDADINNNGQVEYFIISGDQDSLFNINTITGEITTANNIVSASDLYHLVIHAVDKGSIRRTATATVQVTVDPPLTPSANDYTFNVNEDASIGTNIGTIAPDPVHAPGATINFFIISGDTNNDMAINQNNGLISTAKLLNHFTKSEYYITVFVEDQGDTSIKYNKAVHITVVDVNDNTPFFPVPNLALSVVENSPVGISIGSVTANDNDAGVFGTITYEIDPTNTVATSLVTVDSAGKILLVASPDYEALTFFSFFLFAKDGGAPSLTGTSTINVNIIDVNDVDPSAVGNPTPGYFSLECPSNANTQDVITILEPDDFGITTSTTDTVQYITMNDRGVFDFNSTSGEFYVRNSNYLYDQTRYIMWVVIRVQSATGQSNGTSAMIRVDSVTPSLHLVVLKHSVTADVVESQKNQLRASLQAIFPTKRVEMWRIDGISAARRRRLLASQSETTFYVVESTAADTIDGIENEKNFMTQSDLLTVLSQGDGTPASVLTTAAFTSFPVTSVEPYVDTTTSTSQNWAQTTVGIAVITTIVCALVLLAAILILYFWLTRNSDKEYSFDDKEENCIKNNNDRIPYLYATSPIKMELPPEPVLPRSSTPVFKGLSQSQNNVSNRGTKPKKDKHSMTVSMMNFASTRDDVPPALFHDGKYMKENPNADVGREGTITPRQILIESKRSFTGNYSY
ncbi:FAT4 [Mytilus coruscus]|uniref:FAT4 n=1 Tax=Mytilus coruscus TaxID=42192 RepID=A0A6J8EIZ2_MYTCO|nr:FAT4 [Mytilus coruscus]